MAEREHQRASDQAILDMKESIGGLKAMARSGAEDRAHLWNEIKDTNKTLRDGLDEIKTLLAPLPGLVEKVNRHDALIAGNTKSIGDAEKESNRRKWTLAGIATGLGLAGGAGISNSGGWAKFSAWIGKVFGVVLLVGFVGYALAGCTSVPPLPEPDSRVCFSPEWTWEAYRTEVMAGVPDAEWRELNATERRNYLDWLNKTGQPSGVMYDRIGYFAGGGNSTVLVLGIVGKCVWTNSLMSIATVRAAMKNGGV